MKTVVCVVAAFFLGGCTMVSTDYNYTINVEDQEQSYVNLELLLEAKVDKNTQNDLKPVNNITPELNVPLQIVP